MKPERLQEGQELRGVYLPDGEVLRVARHPYTEGVEKLVVVMESGQMAYVPWVAVIDDGVEQCRYNLAHCQGVEVFHEEAPDEA